MAALLLALVLMSPERALAADRVIVRDTHIQRVLALDGLVVYSRFIFDRPDLKRPWMRIVNGRVLGARGMAANRAGESVSATDIGLDPAGRVVVPFSRSRYDAQGTLLSQHWFIYDVAADRARPFRGLPRTLGSCSEIAMWRTRLAYSSCNHVYLRTGKDAREVPIAQGLFWRAGGGGSGGLTLRGAALLGLLTDESDGGFVSLLADSSGFCRETVPGLGAGDAGNLSGWWLSRRYLTWTMRPGVDNGPLMGARLRGNCRTPGPARQFFPVPSGDEVKALDDRFVYYGEFSSDQGARAIRRHRLPTAHR